MNEEIKEILNGLNVVIKHGGSVEINSKECKKIIDYITNLQEELEEQKRIEQASLDTINNLQDENEELKKQNKKLYKKDTKIINELKEELEITQEKWNKDKQWSECRTKEWLDYKQRIDKAIEYIEDNTYEAYETEYIDLTGIKELKNILGGDEE